MAELEPGDALCIPALCWHQVESLSGCNVLVNYRLLHCMLTLRRMPPEARD